MTVLVRRESTPRLIAGAVLIGTAAHPAPALLAFLQGGS